MCPYKFHAKPPEYDLQKHFLRLYKERVDYPKRGFVDFSVLNAKKKLSEGIVDEVALKRAVRTLMNGKNNERKTS